MGALGRICLILGPPVLQLALLGQEVIENEVEVPQGLGRWAPKLKSERGLAASCKCQKLPQGSVWSTQYGPWGPPGIVGGPWGPFCDASLSSFSKVALEPGAVRRWPSAHTPSMVVPCLVVS